MKRIILYWVLLLLCVGPVAFAQSGNDIPPQTYKSVHNPRPATAAKKQQETVTPVTVQTKTSTTTPQSVKTTSTTTKTTTTTTTTAKTEQKPTKEEKKKVTSKEQEKPKKDKSNSWLNRFYNYSGFSSLSYLSAGYTYSCMGGKHMVNASVFDFRVGLFSASLLNVEMSVSPFDKRFAYKPNIRIYIPIAKCFSLVPYGGAEVDASYLGQYFDKSYAYNVDKDFYINAVGGIALNLTAMRHVPIEIRAEYRHPVKESYAGALNPKGVYVGAQIYFGSVFYKKK